MLEADSVVSSDVDFGMQGEAVLVCAQRACSLVERVGVLRLLDQALDRLAGQRAEGDASSNGGGGEEGEDGVGLVLGGRILCARCRPEAASVDEAQDARANRVEQAGDVLLLELWGWVKERGAEWAGGTGNPADRGCFKVPSLRNAGLHHGFFHTGSLLGAMGAPGNTLPAVIGPDTPGCCVGIAIRHREGAWTQTPTGRMLRAESKIRPSRPSPSATI